MAFTVVVDKQEKSPWDFSFDKRCVGSVVDHLKEGDYTTREILELENKLGKKLLGIERKASSGEISTNLGKYKDRFFREMERLSEYEHKYLILEFDLQTLLRFPEDSGIPKKLWYRTNHEGKKVRRIRMNGKFMETRLNTINALYDVEIIYAGNKQNAVDIAANIFEQVYNAYKEEV